MLSHYDRTLVEDIELVFPNFLCAPASGWLIPNPNQPYRAFLHPLNNLFTSLLGIARTGSLLSH